MIKYLLRLRIVCCILNALFIVRAPSLQAQTIDAAEYFVDVDPGVGNGIPVTITAPGDQLTFSFTLNTTGITPGYHYFFIRTRTQEGIWSLSEPRQFLIHIPVTKAEYFFDNDPGVGNGVPLVIPTPGNTVSFLSAVSTAGLAAGRHYLFVRTKSSNENWSISEPREFFIQAPIAMAEYFIDTDPGVGNATPLVIDPMNDVTFSTSITLDELPYGDHYLFIRARDESGNWSLHEPTLFTVSTVLPVGLTSFTARQRGTTVDLSWTTHSEVNNDYFEVERWIKDDSFAEESFVPIGKVAGNGTTSMTQHYQFTDIPEDAETIYYRLKQVDFDRKFTYSQVVVVTFKSSNSIINVHPNPSTTTFTLEADGDTEILSVEMFDISGKKIESYGKVDEALVFGNEWPAGVYVLRVEKQNQVLLTKVVKTQ